MDTYSLRAAQDTPTLRITGPDIDAGFGHAASLLKEASLRKGGGDPSPEEVTEACRDGAALGWEVAAEKTASPH